MIDAAKIRRESMRWYILLTLDNARPVDPHETLVVTTIQAIFGDATQHEVRRELDYLADRSLVKLDKRPDGVWVCGLTHYGVDIAEYTVECNPGIARRCGLVSCHRAAGKASYPPSVKAWLDQALAENNFSDYEALSAELAGRGFAISKSALHRYGQNFEERLSALKVASEQARAVVAAAPDEEGAVNEALMRLVQEHLFKLLMSEGGQFDLPKVAKAVAELGRASVVQKKRGRAEVRSKAEAAAAQVEDRPQRCQCRHRVPRFVGRFWGRHEARPQANPRAAAFAPGRDPLGRQGRQRARGIPRLPAALGRHPRPAQGR
ncbi:DUF3486 family protein [Ectopseudomonas oleovorans]|uniref:DUF3486 family protein n=1 Tax=Ectopseudomonas oleovorans TaxID=301 RepID=UPI003F1C771E